MMATKQLKHCRPLLPYRSTLLPLLFTLLSGCSAFVAKTETTPAVGSAENSQSKTTKADSAPITKPSKPNTKPSEPNTQTSNAPSLCAYESTKGIAEITDINANTITFKFYPGDQYFKSPIHDISDHELKLGQELKAIIRTPISGPCEEPEFRLLTTLE